MEPFCLVLREISLADLVASASTFGRKSIVDGGAVARFIEITPTRIFSELHGAATAKQFAEELAAAACADYGFAGPAVVEWLLSNETEARDRLISLRSDWGLLSTKTLPTVASEQARRVASRLGSIACGAALAAHALDLPWGVSAAVDEHGFAPASRPMLLAFDEILKLWLGDHNNGLESSDNAAVLARIRAFPGRFPTQFHYATSAATAGGHDECVVPHSNFERFGWSVHESRQGANARGAATLPPIPAPVVPQRLHVEFLPDALLEELGLSETQIRRAMTWLDGQGWLTRNQNSPLTFRRRSPQRERVYRVSDNFFTA